LLLHRITQDYTGGVNSQPLVALIAKPTQRSGLQEIRPERPTDRYSTDRGISGRHAFETLSTIKSTVNLIGNPFICSAHFRARARSDVLTPIAGRA